MNRPRKLYALRGEWLTNWVVLATCGRWALIQREEIESGRGLRVVRKDELA